MNCGGIISSYSQTLNEEGLAVSKLFPAGTILMTIAANIGHTGVLKIAMACPDSLVGIICKSGCHNYFPVLFPLNSANLNGVFGT
ncbi:MAG: hypothetical protein IPN85_14440 [Flavobacteriales bacterium]|nr:hypothetical protein [Flavobacteriales bacterium]